MNSGSPVARANAAWDFDGPRGAVKLPSRPKKRSENEDRTENRDGRMVGTRGFMAE